MEAIQERQTTFSFWNARRFAVRVCWNMGRWSRQLHRNLLDPYNNANALLVDVHDRMPVILEPDSYEWWLDPWFKDLTAVSEMLDNMRGAKREVSTGPRMAVVSISTSTTLSNWPSMRRCPARSNVSYAKRLRPNRTIGTKMAISL